MTVPVQNVEHHLDTIAATEADTLWGLVSELLDFAEVIA